MSGFSAVHCAALSAFESAVDSGHYRVTLRLGTFKLRA
jgi:hypothetical protein